MTPAAANAETMDRRQLRIQLGAPAQAALDELVGAGLGDYSAVVSHMLLSLLPQLATAEERVASLQRELAALQGQRRNSGGSRGAAAAADGDGAGDDGESDEDELRDPSETSRGVGLTSTGRRRFFKSVQELDPSARRKRKAKFARALLGLADTYGMVRGRCWRCGACRQGGAGRVGPREGTYVAARRWGAS